ARARPLRRPVGLRLPRADPAHAGHRRRFRPADPPRLRAPVPDGPQAARPRRRAAALCPQDRRPPLVLAVPARRARCPVPVLEDPAAAAGTHQRLPALQLHHPDRAPGVRAMNTWTAAGFQIVQSVFVVLAAPLLLGWVNQCRAWLQNRSAPSILLPYFTLAKL